MICSAVLNFIVLQNAHSSGSIPKTSCPFSNLTSWVKNRENPFPAFAQSIGLVWNAGIKSSAHACQSGELTPSVLRAYHVKSAAKLARDPPSLSQWENMESMWLRAWSQPQFSYYSIKSMEKDYHSSINVKKSNVPDGYAEMSKASKIAALVA